MRFNSCPTVVVAWFLKGFLRAYCVYIYNCCIRVLRSFGFTPGSNLLCKGSLGVEKVMFLQGVFAAPYLIRGCLLQIFEVEESGSKE